MESPKHFCLSHQFLELTTDRHVIVAYFNLFLLKITVFIILWNKLWCYFVQKFFFLQDLLKILTLDSFNDYILIHGHFLFLP